MPKGGARNRSGPRPDPKSRTSERRGYMLTALPSEGYDGPVPDFPLPERAVYDKEWNDAGKQVMVYNAAETARVKARELELWGWLWSTPQACAWSMPAEAWRLPVIALYTRTFVICESGEATAADKNSLHRFADQIGMTTAGLAEMGWRVAPDELAGKRGAEQLATPKRERRLRSVDAQ